MSHTKSYIRPKAMSTNFSQKHLNSRETLPCSLQHGHYDGEWWYQLRFLPSWILPLLLLWRRHMDLLRQLSWRTRRWADMNSCLCEQEWARSSWCGVGMDEGENDYDEDSETWSMVRTIVSNEFFRKRKGFPPQFSSCILRDCWVYKVRGRGTHQSRCNSHMQRWSAAMHWFQSHSLSFSL